MDFEEFKRKEIAASDEAVRFFSNHGKIEREKWVVENFLEGLGISFKEIEFERPVDEPPDVVFRDAAFEITELMDLDRKRHQEKIEQLEKLKAAKSFDDIKSVYPWNRKEIDAEELLIRIEHRLSEKYYAPYLKKQIDIIVYVNLVDEVIDAQGVIISISDNSPIRHWRSVSLLFNGNVTNVLYVSDDAPDFLKCEGSTNVR